MADTTARYRCSFCGKRQEQVDFLIAGTGGAYICDECVEDAWAQVHERRRQRRQTQQSTRSRDRAE